MSYFAIKIHSVKCSVDSSRVERCLLGSVGLVTAAQHAQNVSNYHRWRTSNVAGYKFHSCSTICDTQRMNIHTHTRHTAVLDNPSRQSAAGLPLYREQSINRDDRCDLRELQVREQRSGTIYDQFYHT